jgi:hypothetical protein
VSNCFIIRLPPLQEQSQLQVDFPRAREGGSEREDLIVALFSLFVLSMATVDDAQAIKEGGVCLTGWREMAILHVG